MSEIRVTTLKDTSGGNSSTTSDIFSGRAKAWVNFNGVSTVAIRANFNVSSITDNGTGNYTVNFTNAFSDTNYITVCHVGVPYDQGSSYTMGIRLGTGGTSDAPTSKLAGSVQIMSRREFDNDPSQAYVAVFR